MRIQNMSLRTKLIGGFGILLVLLVVLSLESYGTLKGASEGFTQYREMARDANLAGRLQANMLMVRMNVKDFIITGSEKDLKQYDEYTERMEGFLKTAQKEINNPDRAKKIDLVEEEHIKYAAAFKKVVAFKKERNQQVYEVLNVKGPLMEKSLTFIMETARRDGDADAAYNSGIAMKHLLLGRLYMIKFLDTNSRADSDRVFSEFRKMGEFLVVLDRELQNSERREFLEKVGKARKAYLGGVERVVSIIFERNTVISDTLDRIGPVIAGNVEEVKLSIKGVQDRIGPRLQASNGRAVSMVVWVSVFAIFTGVLLVFLITRNVLHQLGGDPSRIADIARNISDGNLSLNFEREGNLEPTGVYRDMKMMVSNLKKMISDINSGVDTLKSSAGDMTSISTRMSDGAEKTSRSTSSVSVAAEEMSSAMNNVAAATEQTTTNIQMIVAAAEEMSSSINEVAQNTARGNETTALAVENAELVSGKVEELSRAASEISKVTDTISDISEQTNLLALNATIEAARAGDAGKGFAVVAGEIKALSRQTADATREISNKISDVQSTTEESVAAIRTIVGIINDINEIVTSVATAIEEQSATTLEISNNVSQAASGIREVNVNVNQTSTVAGEVTRDIREVSRAADEISDGTRQVDGNAGDLSRLAEELNVMVGRFQV